MRWLSKKITGSVPMRAAFMRPLASYGVAGKTTFRPGNVGAHAGPVLGVLGAVLGADADAQHHRHLQQAAGHRLPLGELVEDLVAGAAHEVAVHQLDERPAALQGVADGRADDRAFGDRRVEQAMIRQGLGQAAIDGERAAPVAVLLAVGDQRRIDVEAVEDGLEEGVADADALALGKLVALVVEGGAAALGELLDARVLLLRVISTSGFRPGSIDSTFWFENIVRSSRQFLSFRSRAGRSAGRRPS